MPGAITSLPPHYQVNFANYFLENLAQQTDQRLAGTYDEMVVTGEAYRGDIIGSQTYAMSGITARAGKTEPSDVPFGFFWVRPRPFDKTTWIDQFDHILLGQLGDPTSPTLKEHLNAAWRQYDLLELTALGGTRYIGSQGTTAQTLPTTGGPTGTGQTVAVTYGSGGTNSGLQLAKLIQADRILNGNNVKREGRFIVITSAELYDLLANVDQVNSVLYNDSRALVDGMVKKFMGLEFKMTELVPYASGSTTIHNCYAWQRDFLLLGMGEGITNTIDRLPQQSNAWQVYTALLSDFTRKQDEGVVQIACDSSV